VCVDTHIERGILTHAHAESNVSYVDDICIHNGCMRFTHDGRNMILFRYMFCISYT
jgi:hypothetical protein